MQIITRLDAQDDLDADGDVEGTEYSSGSDSDGEMDALIGGLRVGPFNQNIYPSRVTRTPVCCTIHGSTHRRKRGPS